MNAVMSLIFVCYYYSVHLAFNHPNLFRAKNFNEVCRLRHEFLFCYIIVNILYEQFFILLICMFYNFLKSIIIISGNNKTFERFMCANTKIYFWIQNLHVLLDSLKFSMLYPVNLCKTVPFNPELSLNKPLFLCCRVTEEYRWCGLWLHLEASCW